MRFDAKLAVLLIAVTFLEESRAFVPRKPNSSPRGKSGIGGNLHGNDGGPPRTLHGEPWASDGPSVQPLMGLWNAENETSYDLELHSLRGGSSAQKAAESVMKGSQATMSSTTSFWKKSFQSMTSKVKKPLQSMKDKVSERFKSQEKREEEALMEQLKTMPVRRVALPESTVIPNEVVQLAARRSGMLGNPLRTDRVQDFAKSLKVWYARKGYALHSVTGATLKPESGTAEITVQEPRTSTEPVEIIFCKEMVVDDETGDLVTFRQYKDKHTARKTLGYDKIEKQNLNTTFVVTSGRIKPSVIASAMRLLPGSHFQWDSLRWQKISTSKIFSRILKATPQPMRDGTVQLQIYALEAPARHLEYGLGKSLYTDTWEGELDFEHVNLLGGGETLGLTVRRGTKDAEPTVRLRYSDEKFGMEGGYDAELFSEFIGDKPDEAQDGDQPPDYEHDGLLDRRGATFRLRNPIDPKIVRHSATSVSLERTATETGLHESIGSTSLSVGPFVKELPFDARSNIDARVTVGTRMVDLLRLKGTDNLVEELNLKPYSSVTATTKQILPIGGSQSGSRMGPLVLALRHSVTTSTSSLPRYEARAMGSLNNIRGTEPNGQVSHILVGTTELRIPVRVPVIKTRQDAGVVVFGDWLVATKDAKSALYRKSSIGVGLRKSVQGIPLHCNFSYSHEGKLKASCGVGKDFDV
jgi:outer membrane protein assembly factor BamA